MKYGFIENHRSEFAVEKMCRTLEVSRSGYYRWRSAPKSDHARANETLSEKIEETYDKFHGIYGSPRITRELQEAGVDCSENRVARLMKQKGIAAKTRRKFKVTIDSQHDLPVAPNLANQNFAAPAPNQLWLSDITYIWTREGWLYLAAILDVFSRQIVGWSMSHQNDQRIDIKRFKSSPEPS